MRQRTTEAYEVESAKRHTAIVRTKRVYTNGYGDETEIDDMEDERIINTIGFIWKKRATLIAAENELSILGIQSAALKGRLHEMRESVIALGEVLVEREKERAK